ncbi:hypothetical protein N0V90_002735 [Kalmusia sp. IMI 367209]|nr:hypothetical protein N0V90_002735 [Kalmusia sp. IMI 367209]
MLQTTAIIALIAGAAAQNTVKFGPYYSLGATSSYIVESDTTVYPGKTPSPQQNRMVLWPGMGTDDDCLIQAIISSSGSEAKALCGATSGQWCIFASVLQHGEQLSGKAVPMNSNQAVRIQYKYNESTKETSQAVSLDGTVVSTISSNSNFIKTLAINEADASTLTTSNDGKTFHVETINVHQHSF